MPSQDSDPVSRQLDSIERSSEVLFGLIMVLTFTGSFGITDGDTDSVHRMPLAALGCNLAWGTIDAVMNLMAIFSQRSHNLLLQRQARAVGPEEGRRLIGDAMSLDLARVITDTEVEVIRHRFTQLREPARRARLHFHDYRAAGVVLPFVFIRRPGLALRISNLVAVIMLFLIGYAYGRYAVYRPLRVGFWMVLVGAGMVVLTAAFWG
jgi:hypothetical protein